MNSSKMKLDNLITVRVTGTCGNYAARAPFRAASAGQRLTSLAVCLLHWFIIINYYRFFGRFLIVFYFQQPKQTSNETAREAARTMKKLHIFSTISVIVFPWHFHSLVLSMYLYNLFSFMPVFLSFFFFFLIILLILLRIVYRIYIYIYIIGSCYQRPLCLIIIIVVFIIINIVIISIVVVVVIISLQSTWTIIFINSIYLSAASVSVL